MRFGKLNSEELKTSILDLLGYNRREVVRGGAAGADCAVVKSDEYILLTTDPITVTDADCARLAVIVSINDIAAGGGEPFACLVTIIAPPYKTAEDIRSVMTELIDEARKHNVDIIGGHTEFSDAVNRTVVSCTMLGKAKELPLGGPQPGDSIIVTKTVGIEGTYILAKEYKEKFTESETRQAAELFDKLCVAKEGAVAKTCGVRLMHDITEGGIMSALAEICGDETGAELYIDKIPIADITRRVCGILSVDPYRLLGSGSMLIITPEPKRLTDALAAKGIPCAEVGRINDCGRAVAVYGDGRLEELKIFADEVYSGR